MKILESFVASPFAQAIGWTLLHSLWEGAVIAALLATVLLATRSARVRYAAACAAMVAMAAAFAATICRLMPESAHNFPRFRTIVPFVSLPSVNPQADTGRSWLAILSMLAPWLAPFWIGGVLLLSLQRVMSCVAVRRMRSRGVCFASEEWHAELARLAAQARVLRPVHLLESCFAEIPMVLGHFRPVILLPIGLLANLPPGQVETILLHELAHIRRCDYLVNAMQRIVESVLFYHPAVWWISKVMRAERENCCDDVVVSVSRHANEYARALAALERNRAPRQQAAVAATGGTLVKRIRRLLYPKAPAGIWAPVAAATIFVVTAAVSFAAWQPRTTQPVPVRTQAEIPEATSFAVKTFYLTNSETPVDIDKIVTALRQVLDSQSVRADYAEKAIIIRDTPEKVSVAGKIIDVEENQTASSNPRVSDQAARLRLEVKTLENDLQQNHLEEVQELRNAIVQENGDPTQRVQNEATENGPYSKWLDEDVVYIITPEERNTFLRLRTAEERDAFINAFWERRNSTPGAADNKFKDEHYRRIAYANEHFATSAIPGWKTDRGRIYITWGAPDQREHAEGEIVKDQHGRSVTAHAYEDWHYRDIVRFNGEHTENVMFEFVDPKGTGDFYLTMDPSERYAAVSSSGQTASDHQRPETIDYGQATGRASLDIATPDTYSKWLNEDVVYIITDEERDTFLHLNTDEEREKFIEAFWERRNPTPGSTDNKFKDEYYRRIAYSNEHFGMPSGKAGWETDRGHIYIVYGAPDARDHFLAGTNGHQFATEEWHYKHIDGVGDNLMFEFVDREGNGDFVLVPSPSNSQVAPKANASDAVAVQPDENLYKRYRADNPPIRRLSVFDSQLHDLVPVRASSPSNQVTSASSASAENNEYAKQGLTILSSTEGVDFGPYIKDMLKSIQTHWYNVMPQEAMKGQASGQVSVIFSIQRDGKLLYWQIPASSGVQSFDEAARDAVRDSFPLEPLPSQFHGPYLKLKLTFAYNQPLHS
jgi:TonB family protein